MMTAMYDVWMSPRYRRELRRMVRRGYDPEKMEAVVDMLAAGEPLPEQYQDHPLRGKWQGFRECHVSPDWLLVYKIEIDKLILALTRTGTHDDLFKL